VLCGSREARLQWYLELGNILSDAFTPALAKHSKSLSMTRIYYFILQAGECPSTRRMNRLPLSAWKQGAGYFFSSQLLFRGYELLLSTGLLVAAP
jgi:hypothetical protein